MNKSEDFSFLEYAEKVFPGSPGNVLSEDTKDMKITGYIPAMVTNLRREGVRVKYKKEKRYWVILDGINRGYAIDNQGNLSIKRIEKLEDEVEVLEDAYSNKIHLRYKGFLETVNRDFVYYFENYHNKNFLDYYKKEKEEEIIRRKEYIKVKEKDIERWESDYNSRYLYMSDKEREEFKSHIENLKQDLKKIRESEGCDRV